MSDRVKRGRGANREVIFETDGVAVNADGDVTVTVTKDSDGSTLLTATASQVTGQTGRYRYTLPGQTDLDKLTETWVGTFGGEEGFDYTYVEIVGGFHVELGELLDLPNLTGFSVPKLVEAREWFEAKVENYCGVAFVPRYAKATLSGLGTSRLILPHMKVRTVRSVTVAGTAQTGLSTWALYDWGEVVRDTGTFTKGNRNVVAVYEHGYDEPPADLQRVALDAIRDRVKKDHSGGEVRRTYAVATEAGIIRDSVPGPDRPFGVPEWDAVVNSYKATVPAIA